MHRILPLVTVAALLLPSLAAAEGAPDLLESAEAAAVRFAAEQDDDEPERRRSMVRTWVGVGLIGAGLAVAVARPLHREACVVTAFGSACAQETNTGGLTTAIGLIVLGGGLASVWSDVPANSIGFTPLPGGGRVRVSLGF